MLPSCNMLSAPGNPVPGAAHGLEDSDALTDAAMVLRDDALGARVAGAVMSAQAVVRTEAITALAVRSTRPIM